MPGLGSGASRSRRVRATIPDPAAVRAPDMVNRPVPGGPARGLLHVADFTCTSPSASARTPRSAPGPLQTLADVEDITRRLELRYVAGYVVVRWPAVVS
jgi:hypothetical protein